MHLKFLSLQGVTYFRFHTQPSFLSFPTVLWEGGAVALLLTPAHSHCWVMGSVHISDSTEISC